MKFKSFFSACVLALSFLYASPEVKATAVNPAVSIQQGEDDYFYVEVNIDGVNWIIVYDSKGNIVRAYPED